MPGRSAIAPCRYSSLRRILSLSHVVVVAQRRSLASVRFLPIRKQIPQARRLARSRAAARDTRDSGSSQHRPAQTGGGSGSDDPGERCIVLRTPARARDERVRRERGIPFRRGRHSPLSSARPARLLSGVEKERSWFPPVLLFLEPFLRNFGLLGRSLRDARRRRRRRRPPSG